MSRSAVIALGVFLVLLAAVAAISSPYWHELSPRWLLAILLFVTAYGTATAAAAIRRLVDPKLPVPMLVWIMLAGFWLMSALGAAQRRVEDGVTYVDNDRPSSSSSWDDNRAMGRWRAFFAALGALVLFCAGPIVAMHFLVEREHPAQVAEAPKPTAKPVSVERPPPPPDITSAKNLAAAIDFARPQLTDTRDAPSDGAKLLVRYGAAKLKWADVAVAKDETTFAVVLQDPAAAIGKRLCAAVRVERIEKVTVNDTAVHTARLVTKPGNALEVYVVGAPVKQGAPARFCGVVTGRLDVAKKSAAFAVGMFGMKR
jgi:hypothetical protein